MGDNYFAGEDSSRFKVVAPGASKFQPCDSIGLKVHRRVAHMGTIAIRLGWLSESW